MLVKFSINVVNSGNVNVNLNVLLVRGYLADMSILTATG